MYDEFRGNLGGSLIHSILLSNGWEVQLRFRNLLVQPFHAILAQFGFAKLKSENERLRKENDVLRKIVDSEVALARPDCKNAKQLLDEINERKQLLDILD